MNGKTGFLILTTIMLSLPARAFASQMLCESTSILLSGQQTSSPFPRGLRIDANVRPVLKFLNVELTGGNGNMGSPVRFHFNDFKSKDERNPETDVYSVTAPYTPSNSGGQALNITHYFKTVKNLSAVTPETIFNSEYTQTYEVIGGQPAFTTYYLTCGLQK